MSLVPVALVRRGEIRVRSIPTLASVVGTRDDGMGYL